MYVGLPQKCIEKHAVQLSTPQAQTAKCSRHAISIQQKTENRQPGDNLCSSYVYLNSQSGQRVFRNTM